MSDLVAKPYLSGTELVDVIVTGEHGIRQDVLHVAIEDYLDWADAAKVDLDPQHCSNQIYLTLFQIFGAMTRLEAELPPTLMPGEIVIALDGVLYLTCGLVRLGILNVEDLICIGNDAHAHILEYVETPVYKLVKDLSRSRFAAYGNHPDFVNVFDWPDDL